MSAGKLSHLQINVKQENLPFYKELFTFLGWDPFYSGEGFEQFQAIQAGKLTCAAFRTL